MKIPLSIVITTYNREKELRRCIESILEQSYEEYEIIVIDDNSRPSYKEYIITDFPTVKYFYQKVNKGPGAARNIGIQVAEHNYVVIMDDDDIFTPEAFDKINNFLTKNNELNDPVVHFLCSTTRLKENIQFKNYTFQEYLQGVVSGDTAHIINKREFLDKYNYSFPDSRIGAELLLWYKIIIEHGYTIVNETVVEVMQDSNERLTNTDRQIKQANLFAQYQIDIIREFESEIIKAKNTMYLITKYRGAIIYSLLAGNRQTAMKYLKKSLNYSKKQIFFLPLFLFSKKIIEKLFIKYRE